MKTSTLQNQCANPAILSSRLYNWKPVIGEKLLGISIGRVLGGSEGVSPFRAPTFLPILTSSKLTSSKFAPKQDFQL